jgi:hypothetical protein
LNSLQLGESGEKALALVIAEAKSAGRLFDGRIECGADFEQKALVVIEDFLAIQ